MVLYVSPYVNHKIKYSKETIWLKLENTSIRIFVVIYIYVHLKSDYYSTMLFPGKLFCFKSSSKLIQQAVSTFQHYWKWRGGGWRVELNNLEKVWGVAYYLFYISWYYKSNFYIKKSIPFLDIRTSFFLFKEIHLIDFYIKKSDWLFYIIDFFHIRKWIFYIKNQFLISRNTEWIVKRHLSAPFYYLFDFFNFLI